MFKNICLNHHDGAKSYEVLAYVVHIVLSLKYTQIQMHRWLVGWMDGWMDGWVDG